MAKFGAEIEAAGVVLAPVVVETFGRWGADTDQVFDFVAKASAARGNATAERTSAFLWSVLSVATCALCWGDYGAGAGRAGGLRVCEQHAGVAGRGLSVCGRKSVQVRIALVSRFVWEYVRLFVGHLLL